MREANQRAGGRDRWKEAGLGRGHLRAGKVRVGGSYPCGRWGWGLAGGARSSGVGVCVILTSPPFSSQMAQRLALRRLLALGRRPLPLGPRPLAPQGLPGRAFGSSAIRGSAFNVQDGGDFQERVVNSPKPVVVDFHAQ